MGRFKNWLTDDGFGEGPVSQPATAERKMPNHVVWFLATVILFFVWLPLAVITLIIWVAVTLSYVQRGTGNSTEE